MIFLYHSVIPDDSPLARSCAGQALKQSAFERQIRWLADRYTIVSLDQYLVDSMSPDSRRGHLIALTFDDGFALTYRCVYPILAQMNIPATIFTTTGHLNHGELVWFSYLKGLCFENLYPSISVSQCAFSLKTIAQRKHAWSRLRKLAKESGSPTAFCRELSKLYPLPQEISDLYGGMTSKQIKEACNIGIFELGAHTITHPFLWQLPTENQEKEIAGSKRILSEQTGKPVRYFAYPGGEYNNDSVELTKKAGYEAAFATIPLKITEPRFEIGRTGIYSPSLFKLRAKSLGATNLARRFGLKVG